MNAVAEAKSLLYRFPRLKGEKKLPWLEAASEFFGLTFSQAKKIEYDEVKGIDADKLRRMRAIYEEKFQLLEDLRAQADDNQERINSLIYLRNELRSGRGRPPLGSADPGAADGDGAAADRGGEVRSDRAANAPDRVGK